MDDDVKNKTIEQLLLSLHTKIAARPLNVDAVYKTKVAIETLHTTTAVVGNPIADL